MVRRVHEDLGKENVFREPDSYVVLMRRETRVSDDAETTASAKMDCK